MQLSLPELDEVLDEIEFFERERTDRHVVEVAILLYDCGVSLRLVAQVLSWIGVERSHVTVWEWIQKFGQRLGAAGRRPAADLPAVVLMDETVVKQRGHEFTCLRRSIRKHVTCCMLRLPRRETTSPPGDFSTNSPTCTAERRRSW